MPASDRKKIIFSFLPIAILNLIVYSSSLFHVPRSDQLIYLANTAGQKGWITLAIKNYAHNRMDLSFGMQDNLLFRPIFYFLIGTEKYFFNDHFIYWQLTGILLHLMVVWYLLKLLMQIHNSIFAALLTAFFYPPFIDYRGKSLDLSFVTIMTILTGLWMILIYANVIKQGFSPHVYKQKRGILGLLWCMMFVQGFMICLGRISLRGLEGILVENTYNNYFFWVFGVLFVYYSIPFDHLKKLKKYIPLRRISIILLITLTYLNASSTLWLNRGWAHIAKQRHDLDKDIKILTKKHSPEEDFSFGIHSYFNPWLYLPWVEGPQGEGYNYFQLLYPQYYNQSNPQYLLIPDGDHGWKWQEKN